MLILITVLEINLSNCAPLILKLCTGEISYALLWYTYDNWVKKSAHIGRISLKLEIRRFSARNWPIMRWIVYGY